MKKITPVYFLFALLQFLANEGLSQKSGKDNLLKISKSYLEYQVTQSKLDTNTVIFLVAANTFNRDSFWFEISCDNINNLIDLKYSKVYQLENFKLIVNEEFDKSNTLKQIYKETSYEDFNKGKRDGVIREHYQRWELSMNKKYEVMAIHSTFPIKNVIKALKKNKVRFSKDFKFN